MMITQQVVTYIKDQLARGTDRTKIRANLLSAGWVESDINQAFSFAEPNQPSAAVKIAPAFAIEEEIKPKSPIDKTEIATEPVMPILQKDTEKKEPSNLSTFTEGTFTTKPAMNLDSSPVSNPMSSVSVSPSSKPVESTIKPEVSLNNIVKTPISNPTPIQPLASSPVRNTIETDVVRNFESVSGSAMNPVSNKKSSSSVLKVIAGLLFLFLIAGNAYLWFIVLPGMQKSSQTEQVVQNPMDNLDQSQRQMNNPVENVVNTASSNSTGINTELGLPVSNLQAAAASYFTRYNSYGGASMALGSCGASGTVFSDNTVKESLSEISRITGRSAQCALGGDNTSSNRTVSYIVYIPMEDGGYCIDSMGANMAVTKIPTSTSCVTGL